MHRLSIFLVLLAAWSGGTPPFAFAEEAPVTYVTRSEAVTLLLKHSGWTVTPLSKTSFPDVPGNAWFAPYMVHGEELGMIEAETGTNLLHPDRSVSRAEFLKMMTVAFGLPRNVPHAYIDVPKGVWYAEFAGINALYKLFGIQSSYLLHPEARVTHREAAGAVYALIAAEPLLGRRSQTLGKTSGASSAPVLSLPSPPLQNAAASAPSGVNLYVSGSSPSVVKAAFLHLLKSRSADAAAKLKNALIVRINEERAAHGLHALRENYYLEAAAQAHAKDMHERGYFSHFTPEGLSYVDRIRASGYLDIRPTSCSCPQRFVLGAETTGPNSTKIERELCGCQPIFALGENLARGQLTVDEVVQDWMNSPPHRKNILRKEFEEIGIGIFGDVWAQEFGKVEFY